MILREGGRDISYFSWSHENKMYELGRDHKYFYDIIRYNTGMITKSSVTINIFLKTKIRFFVEWFSTNAFKTKKHAGNIDYLIYRWGKLELAKRQLYWSVRYKELSSWVATKISQKILKKIP